MSAAPVAAQSRPPRLGASAWPCASFGPGTGRTAVVLGPVSPEWNGAAFCGPLVDLLTGLGYRVEVLDSLHPLLDLAEGGDGASVTSAAGLAALAERLQARLPVIHLLAGYALGGTLAMALAPRLAALPSVLSLSGPGFADASLRAALRPILARLALMDLTGGLDLLSKAVAPSGSRPATAHQDQVTSADTLQAIHRMNHGFGVLMDLDVRPLLSGYRARLLALTGERSLLATADNLGFLPDGIGRIHAVVPGAGMRILVDNPEASLGIIKEWLIHDNQDPGSPR